MEEYQIKVAIPSKTDFWRADVEERYIKAKNFNDMLVKALTQDEVRAGVRILRIERRLQDRYCSWEILKWG